MSELSLEVKEKYIEELRGQIDGIKNDLTERLDLFKITYSTYAELINYLESVFTVYKGIISKCDKKENADSVVNSKSGILEFIELQESEDREIYEAMFKNNDKTSCSNYIKHQFKNLNSHFDSMCRKNKISTDTKNTIQHYTHWYEKQMLEDLEKLVDIDKVVVTTCYNVHMYSKKVANFIIGVEEISKERCKLEEIYALTQNYLNDEKEEVFLEKLSLLLGREIIASDYPIEYYNNNSDHMTRMIRNRQQ